MINLANCRCLRVFLRYLFSHAGLFCLLTAYVMVGAFIFQALEASIELQERSLLPARRQQYLKEIWSSTFDKKFLDETNWTVLNDDEKLKLFERAVKDAVKSGGYDDEDGNDLQWSFYGSLLYCITVIFTIGYGRTSPKTDVGKLLTIIYALIGIPMALLFLADVGNFLATSFKLIYSNACFLCRSCGRKKADSSPKNITENQDSTNGLAEVPILETCNKSPTNEESTMLSTLATKLALMMEPEATPVVDEQTHKDFKSSEDQTVPIYVALFLLAGYILTGGVLFALWEKWWILDSVYFCFMTLSTIGFGDVYFDVAFSDIQDGRTKKIFCCIYLIVGLLVLAMCFNLLKEEMVRKGKNLARNLGLIEVNEVD